MRLGDLLIRARLVTEQDVARAVARIAQHDGRVGDNLVAIGAISQKALDAFIHRIPAEPANLAATGIDETQLLALLMKLIYTGRLETNRQFMEAIRLPYHVVLDLVHMAVDRALLRTLGSRDSNSLMDMSYAITDEGRRYTIDALQRLRYVGPAPVTIEEFNLQVNLQKLTNELVTFERIREALSDLVFEEAIIEQCGPALNSGRAILLYGPPGNGKSSVAFRLASVFKDVIYVPYAVSIEGQIIRVHDPMIHRPLDAEDQQEPEPETTSFLRREEFDGRWVPCRRPFVMAGGELTLDMLDLRYDNTGHFYEAPLHVKALGGCFIIDDFGRQLVRPTDLLNRWIVPLESRVDYLKLHTGKSFSIPFEELVIFSTNLEPEDLMDTAFLRRLPYKIDIASPSRELYKRIFQLEAERHGLTMDDETFDFIVHMIQDVKELELAAYHPRFILDQVVSTCRFMGQKPHCEPRFIEYAINNLRVRQGTGSKPAKHTAARMV
jgi:hypothetical protein